MRPDVVIPYHSKDRPILPWSVKGIRTHLDVGNIFIIAHPSCKQEIEESGATFMDEGAIVPGLSIQSHTHPRWGWYFQQILKLGMADHVQTEYYLVVDSDTVFLRPVPFFKNGKPLYATGTEYHRPYFDVFRRMLGFKAKREYSFVTHHMLMKSALVKEVRSCFREVQPWHLNIMKYVVPQPPWNQISQFSEYETYGHYLKKYYRDEVNIRPLEWRNSALVPDQEVLDELAREYDYVSFQEFLRRELR